MATKLLVNGQEKELRYNYNGIDISADFIGNAYHGMEIDDEGRFVTTTDEFEWWKNTIAGHEQMDAIIIGPAMIWILPRLR